MVFKKILQALVEGDCGALGGIIMGYDGIAIDEYQAAGADLDVQGLAVEYASVLKEIKRTVGVLKTGELEEISIITGDCIVLVRGVNDDFFVALVLAADGNFGKGRYLLKREAPKLREELQ
jgi:predicted regulator of Ras-like GTPase activity (Roadblock/LC7/MglB family)